MFSSYVPISKHLHFLDCNGCRIFGERGTVTNDLSTVGYAVTNADGAGGASRLRTSGSAG